MLLASSNTTLVTLDKLLAFIKYSLVFVMTISLHWIVYTESVFIGSIWFDAYGVIRTWTGVIFNTYLIIEENAPKRGKMTCSGGKDRLISFYNLIANACVYWIISWWIDLGLFFFFCPTSFSSYQLKCYPYSYFQILHYY